MSRITRLTGFPEWLPRERVVEQHVLDTLRQTFELHGFSGIETRAVEHVDFLLRKGEIDKEVYAVRRVHADERDHDQLALHFDLTVPFARYVLENAGKLEFPFKRYQIQKVWRGERPQNGRFREFIQADIDVVDRDTLSSTFEVELPLVIADAFAALDLGQARMHVNNRKLAEGFYRGIDIDDAAAVFRHIDKLDKIGPDKVADLLAADGLTAEQAKQCLALASISATDESFVDQVRALGVQGDLLDEGLEELARVVTAAAEDAPGFLVADLKIARGLDYYTGTVYETVLAGHEALGSICSGGRYDKLASDGKTTYPGVGLSIGVSRLVSRLIGEQMVTATRGVPTAVLVAVTDEERRRDSDRVAKSLRSRQIPTEVSPSAAKFGKQIKYADRRGIPFVWFVGDDGAHEIKDIRSGEQIAADPETWTPSEADRLVAVIQKEQS
ncbi:histidyl-tRNA synthetase [Antricoccus suffuscus]|uniref:Histidine--tRNA ligase n=1 Tax=Antricoccus suffuscus TaxID=1629062 RepID=A0A2T0ZW90_9ACTN|nr:histidine--tRNA ligase [Antricoccus suffuscus]PRZ40616.1 histidyl-tRNA synthetase [Antricoccus suffuscus]